MRNVRYNFSSSHVDVPSPLADEIIDWGKANVTDDEIYVVQGIPLYGREDEMHVTALYGIVGPDPQPVAEAAANFGKVHVTLGEIEIFETPNFDVVVINVFSDELRRLNKALSEHTNHINRYPVYRPHITVAYVKSGKGWRHNHSAVFQNREFTADTLIFSSSHGCKHQILLTTEV